MKTITAILVTLCLSATAHSATVSISWDYPYPLTYIGGFRIYEGQASRQYTNVIDCPGSETRTGSVSNISADVTRYFAVTAYNTSTNESDYSAELVWDNEPPVVVGPESISVELPAGAPMVLPDYTSLVRATDDFSEPAAITIRQEPIAGAPLVAGMTVSWLAVDEAGNTGRLDRVAGVTIILTEPVTGVAGQASNGRALLINGGAR